MDRPQHLSTRARVAGLSEVTGLVQDEPVTNSSSLDVRDLRMLARLCDAARAMTLSGRLDPEAVTTLRRRMNVDATDDGGSD